MDSDLKILLQDAKQTIRHLQSENKIMAARLDMFDQIMTVFFTVPNNRAMGMGEDIAWNIEKFIEQNCQPVSNQNPKKQDDLF